MRVIKGEDRKVHLSFCTSTVRHPDDKTAHVLPLSPSTRFSSLCPSNSVTLSQQYTHVSHEASRLFMLTQYLLERIGASAHSHGSPSYFGQRRRKRIRSISVFRFHSRWDVFPLFFLSCIFICDLILTCGIKYCREYSVDSLSSAWGDEVGVMINR